MSSCDLKLFQVFERRLKLVKIGKDGKIYIPKIFRELFKGYRFAIMVEEGKIILDPVKVEDEPDSGEGDTGED